MQIQTAVVQVDASYHTAEIVTQKDFGVDKAGGVFVDSNAGTHKLPVMTLRQRKSGTLVRDVGKDDAHIDASFGSKL